MRQVTPPRQQRPTRGVWRDIPQRGVSERYCPHEASMAGERGDIRMARCRTKNRSHSEPASDADCAKLTATKLPREGTSAAAKAVFRSRTRITQGYGTYRDSEVEEKTLGKPPIPARPQSKVDSKHVPSFFLPADRRTRISTPCPGGFPATRLSLPRAARSQAAKAAGRPSEVGLRNPRFREFQRLTAW